MMCNTKFSGKLANLSIKRYQRDFKKESEETVNLSTAGMGHGALREEQITELEKSLKHTSSKLQSKGKIKYNSEGKPYISFF